MFSALKDIDEVKVGETFYQDSLSIPEICEVYDFLKDTLPAEYSLWGMRMMLGYAVATRGLLICREKKESEDGWTLEIKAVAVFWLVKNPHRKRSVPKPDPDGTYVWCEWLWSKAGMRVVRDFIRFAFERYPGAQFLAFRDGRIKNRHTPQAFKVHVQTYRRDDVQEEEEKPEYIPPAPDVQRQSDQSAPILREAPQSAPAQPGTEAVTEKEMADSQGIFEKIHEMKSVDPDLSRELAPRVPPPSWDQIEKRRQARLARQANGR